MHEVTHVLGFDATSFTLFRDSLGNPRTPRDTTFPTQVAAAYIKSVTCTIEGGACDRIAQHVGRGWVPPNFFRASEAQRVSLGG